jgi:rubredoxin-NAD+ reductase
VSDISLHPSATGSDAPQTLPLLIVGAGLAAWTVVRELRKLDAQRRIVMLSSDSADFYAKPTLSNALAQKRSADQLVTTPAAKMAETLQVQLLPHTRVNSLDTGARALSYDDATGQSHSLHFGDLVLATGADPIRLPMAGSAAAQVQSINHLQDLARFHQVLGAAPKTVLVIGAGLIGCEFANDLLIGGYGVHVVDPSPRPLALLLPAAAGEQLQEALQGQGVAWHLGTTVQSLDADASSGRLHATLADGSHLQVDAVLSAVGLRANIALAGAAGMVCERGIVVDAHLQTSAAHVYALGDCAQYASAGARVLPYVMPIMNAAKALSATLAGQPTELVFPLMPVAVKTPALPIVVAAPHPALSGQWTQDAGLEAGTGGVWRFVDAAGQQRGFVLTGKQSSRRMELAKTTLL